MRDDEDLTDLIRAAAGGDRRAFADLVLKKRERVVRTAFQITGNLEDAKDVAQGVFLKLWKVLQRFDLSKRFDTWLYRITVNAAIDHVRSLHTPGPEIHSIAVRSDGSYGFDEGIWASVPVRTTAPGTYEVVREGFEHGEFAASKIAATNAELVEERDTVKELLAG